MSRNMIHQLRKRLFGGGTYGQCKAEECKLKIYGKNEAYLILGKKEEFFEKFEKLRENLEIADFIDGKNEYVVLPLPSEEIAISLRRFSTLDQFYSMVRRFLSEEEFEFSFRNVYDYLKSFQELKKEVTKKEVTNSNYSPLKLLLSRHLEIEGEKIFLSNNEEEKKEVTLKDYLTFLKEKDSLESFISFLKRYFSEEDLKKGAFKSVFEIDSEKYATLKHKGEALANVIDRNFINRLEVQRIISENANLSSEIIKLNSEKRNLKSIVDDFDQKHQQLREELHKKYQKAIEELRSLVVSLKIENDNLKASLKDFYKEKNEIKNLTNTHSVREFFKKKD